MQKSITNPFYMEEVKVQDEHSRMSETKPAASNKVLT